MGRRQRLVFDTFPFVQYNEYGTVVEHVSAPVPKVDNIYIQIYMYKLCIHNKYKGTDRHPYRHVYVIRTH